MKIAIIGATGMIGHRLWSGLSSNHDVFALVRRKATEIPNLPNIKRDQIYEGMNIENFDSLSKRLSQIGPDVVFNCVGVVKQLKLAKSYTHSIELNSLFPHKLASLGETLGFRIIQFSSDCIFDGRKGQYTEDDLPNATDIYGRTKALGEVADGEHVLTLRTSFLGREIFPHGGLINWFESQAGGKIKGFSKAIYSGLPAQCFVELLNDTILPNKGLKGLYHLSSEPIDKYRLLKMAREVLDLDIEIEKDESFEIDRSLNCRKFSLETGYSPLKWEEMISKLAVDQEFYINLKEQRI
jgi:dTDP-4-dehydrorhamnose reductase